MITEHDFTEIYNAQSPKVFKLCLGYASGDVDLAKEWLQETFIKVWNNRTSFKQESSIETWIYRIAVNTCLSDLRRIKNKTGINEDILKFSTEDNPIDKEEDLKKMFRCINQLTTQNKALILMELEDIPQTTIAESLGLAHGAVRTRISRIRKALLKCIKNGK